MRPTDLQVDLLLAGVAAGMRSAALARTLDMAPTTVRRRLAAAPDRVAAARAVAAELRARDTTCPPLVARAARWDRAMRQQVPDAPAWPPTAPLTSEPSTWPGVARTAPEAFRRWFGASQMVDASGRPRIVYHATNAAEDFTVFDRTEDVGFHTGTLLTATHRALTLHASEDAGLSSGARLMPLYLRLERPLRVHDCHLWGPRNVLRAIEPHLTPDLLDEAEGWELFGQEELAQLLAHIGCDGIVYENETEIGGDSWLVTNPAQLKSALTNDGGFRLDDPRITR